MSETAGHTRNAIVHHAGSTGAKMIGKPYSFAELSAKTRDTGG